MTTLYVILLLLAALCFAVRAFTNRVTDVHLVALGLFFWSLVPLITMAKRL